MTTDTVHGAPRWWDHPPAEWPVFHAALRWAMDTRGEVLPSPLGPTLTVGRNSLAVNRIAAELRRLPQPRWPAAAARHLADQGDRAPVAVGGSAPDLDAVRPRLLPRDSVGEDLPITVELALDLVGTLALVEPSGERRVSADDLAAWNRPAAEVWELAVANLAREEVTVELRATQEYQGPIYTVTGSGQPAAHVLRLAQLHPQPAPDGFLVAMPHPELLLFTPLVGMDWILTLRELPGVVSRLYGGQFGALSPSVHWVVDWRFERVGIEDTGSNVTLRGSERFSAVTQRLMQAATGR